MMEQSCEGLVSAGSVVQPRLVFKLPLIVNEKPVSNKTNLKNQDTLSIIHIIVQK